MGEWRKKDGEQKKEGREGQKERREKGRRGKDDILDLSSSLSSVGQFG